MDKINSVNENQNSSGEGAKSPRPTLVKDFCSHSMMVESCISCWRGHAVRQAKYIERLQASMALPIKERVEVIIEQSVREFYEYWKHHWLNVKDNPEQWIKNATYHLSWCINRALPMVDEKPNEPEARNGDSDDPVASTVPH